MKIGQIWARDHSPVITLQTPQPNRSSPSPLQQRPQKNPESARARQELVRHLRRRRIRGHPRRLGRWQRVSTRADIRAQGDPIFR